MNEAGLNAKWLGCDMSDPRTQKFTKEVLTHMRNRLSDYQEEYPGELFNLRRLRQNLRHIVLQNMTVSAGRISVQPEAKEILRIIPTVPICR